MIKANKQLAKAKGPMRGTGAGFVAKAMLQVGPEVIGAIKISSKKDSGIDQGLFPEAGGKGKGGKGRGRY